MSHEVNWYGQEFLLSSVVYYCVCSTPGCSGTLHYDGAHDGILNMGTFLVHHSVLRDYLLTLQWDSKFNNFNASCKECVSVRTWNAHVLCAYRSPMYTFFQIWTRRQASVEDPGAVAFTEHCNYNRFRSAWYSFLRNLDMQIDDAFICTHCGSHPSILVCDGTALAFR